MDKQGSKLSAKPPSSRATSVGEDTGSEPRQQPAKVPPPATQSARTSEPEEERKSSGGGVGTGEKQVSKPAQQQQQQQSSPLARLMERTGYSIVQQNGQRRYGPPPNWEGNPPPRGCEVFVGKIPRDCFEDELVPVFERTGKIYEMRLMMDYNGQNRGYAFVVYTVSCEAKECVKLLNNYEIRKVSKCLWKRILYVQNIVQLYMLTAR